MREIANPLLCDVETGLCEIPADIMTNNQDLGVAKLEKPVTMVYFTDPICSSCWAIEPQLRKLALEYGFYFDVEYIMGGLLPNWSYNSGGISKPSDVAFHWDKVSGHYDMPIDGDIWLEDPLDSSYPPSIAFKAAQIQDSQNAKLFLRELREMVFLKKKNITRWEHMRAAAEVVGLDTEQLKLDYEGLGKESFENDLVQAREKGVRGFPTIFFLDKAGNAEVVYGSKEYADYESALLRLCPGAIKNSFDKSWKALFKEYKSLTAREFSELSGVARADGEAILDELVNTGKLTKYTTKNGGIWILQGG